MRTDRMSPWLVRQIARRIVIRRLAVVAMTRATDLREPVHGETPLSADEVSFGMQKGIILGPVDVRRLHAAIEPVQPGVPALRRQADTRPAVDEHSRSGEAGAVPRRAPAMARIRSSGSGPASAGLAQRGSR